VRINVLILSLYFLNHIEIMIVFYKSESQIPLNHHYSSMNKTRNHHYYLYITKAFLQTLLILNLTITKQQN
jgi:hypothetical protein